jgi:diguanylate cyclase (GGDEF)-like protein
LLGGPNQEPLREDEVEDLAFLRVQVGHALENADKHLGAKRLAYLDDLTKVYNQSYLDVVVNREIGLATADESRVFSMLFLDLDNFKGVNDVHGHLNGSRVLIELSRVLQRTVREFDLVFRFGGDEFVVYLHDCGSGGALNAGKRMCERIARHPFLAREGLKVSVTASIGVASFPEHAKTRDELLRLADQAMYAVKRATRNGVYLANDIKS